MEIGKGVDVNLHGKATQASVLVCVGVAAFPRVHGTARTPEIDQKSGSIHGINHCFAQ